MNQETERKIRSMQDFLNMGSDTHTFTREEAIKELKNNGVVLE